MFEFLRNLVPGLAVKSKTQSKAQAKSSRRQVAEPPPKTEDGPKTFGRRPKTALSPASGKPGKRRKKS